MVKQDLLPEVIVGMHELQTTDALGTVATIVKSRQGEIQIGYRQFANRRYGELRYWYRLENETEPRPSNKGVTFRPDLAEQIAVALRVSETYLTTNVPQSIAGDRGLTKTVSSSA